MLNSTPFQAASFAHGAADGAAQQILLVKGTWRLVSGKLAAADRQLPLLRDAITVRLFALPLEPVQCAALKGCEHEIWTRFESDYTPPKPCFDLLINGWAQTNDAKAYQRIPCAVEFNAKRLLDLHGHAPRHWSRAAVLDPAIEAALPVHRVPMLYPFAFGGCGPREQRDQNERDPKANTPAAPARWPHNQYGMGYHHAAKAARQMPLPWIEFPKKPIRHWNDTPPVLALGHTSVADLPRRALQGTFDDVWRTRRAPALPLDFDPRSRNAAAEPLQLATCPKAGDVLTLLNLGPGAHHTIRFPSLRLEAQAERADGTRLTSHWPVWDTLIAEPEEDHFALVWRAAIPDPGGRLSRITLLARAQE